MKTKNLLRKSWLIIIGLMMMMGTAKAQPEGGFLENSGTTARMMENGALVNSFSWINHSITPSGGYAIPTRTDAPGGDRINYHTWARDGNHVGSFRYLVVRVRLRPGITTMGNGAAVVVRRCNWPNNIATTSPYFHQINLMSRCSDFSDSRDTWVVIPLSTTATGCDAATAGFGPTGASIEWTRGIIHDTGGSMMVRDMYFASSLPVFPPPPCDAATPVITGPTRICRGNLNLQEVLNVDSRTNAYWQTTATGTSREFPAYEGTFSREDTSAGGTGTSFFLRRVGTAPDNTECWSPAVEVTVVNRFGGLPCENQLPYSRAGWIATASMTAGGTNPQHVLDGDITSRWGNSQTTAWTPNGWRHLTIDMLEPRPFTRIIMDANGGDFPNQFSLYISDDGATWTNILEDECGVDYRIDNRTYVGDFGVLVARFIRVTNPGTEGTTCTGHTGWWSVNEFNVEYTAPLDCGEATECPPLCTQPEQRYLIASAETITCGGEVTISVNNPQEGVTYALFRGATQVGNDTQATGGAVEWTITSIYEHTTFTLQVMPVDDFCLVLNMDEVTVNVETRTPETRTLSAPASVCYNDRAIISVNNPQYGVTYALFMGEAQVGENIAATDGAVQWTSVPLTANTQFILRVIEANCFAANNNMAQITVTVIPAPEAPVVTTQMPICRGVNLNDSITIGGAGAENVFWQTTATGTSTDFPAFGDNRFTRDEGTFYLRRMIEGCWSAHATVEVTNGRPGETVTVNRVSPATATARGSRPEGTGANNPLSDGPELFVGAHWDHYAVRLNTPQIVNVIEIITDGGWIGNQSVTFRVAPSTTGLPTNTDGNWPTGDGGTYTEVATWSNHGIFSLGSLPANVTAEVISGTISTGVVRFTITLSAPTTVQTLAIRGIAPRIQRISMFGEDTTAPIPCDEVSLAVAIDTITHNSVELSWYDTGTDYTVTICGVVSEECTTISDGFNRANGRVSITIEGLTPYTEYNFTVAPTTGSILPVDSSFRTSEVPPVPPTCPYLHISLRIVDYTANSIAITSDITAETGTFNRANASFSWWAGGEIIDEELVGGMLVGLSDTLRINNLPPGGDTPIYRLIVRYEACEFMHEGISMRLPSPPTPEGYDLAITGVRLNEDGNVHIYVQNFGTTINVPGGSYTILLDKFVGGEATGSSTIITTTLGDHDLDAGGEHRTITSPFTAGDGTFVITATVNPNLLFSWANEPDANPANNTFTTVECIPSWGTEIVYTINSSFSNNIDSLCALNFRTLQGAMAHMQAHFLEIDVENNSTRLDRNVTFNVVHSGAAYEGWNVVEGRADNVILFDRFNNAGGYTFTLSGSGVVNPEIGSVVIRNSNNITLENLRMTSDAIALDVIAGNGITLKDNEITSTGSTAVQIAESTIWEINNNRITALGSGSGAAISITESTSPRFERNNIASYSAGGVYIRSDERIDMFNNVVRMRSSDAERAIEIATAGEGSVSLFHNTVYVRGGYIMNIEGLANVMSNNFFGNRYASGLGNAPDAMIFDNNIYISESGISYEGNLNVSMEMIMGTDAEELPIPANFWGLDTWSPSMGSSADRLSTDARADNNWTRGAYEHRVELISVDTIVWTGMVDDDWNNPLNWRVRDEAFSGLQLNTNAMTVAPNAVVIMPAPVNSQFHAGEITRYPSASAPEAVGGEGISKIILEDGAPLLTEYLTGINVQLDLWVNNRMAWYLVGANIRPGGDQMRSGDYYLEGEPQVFMSEIYMAGDVVNFGAPFETTTRFIEDGVPFAIRIPDQYGPARVPASFHFRHDFTKTNVGVEPVLIRFVGGLIEDKTHNDVEPNVPVLMTNSFMAPINVRDFIDTHGGMVQTYEMTNADVGSWEPGAHFITSDTHNVRRNHIRPMEAFIWIPPTGAESSITLVEREICDVTVVERPRPLAARATSIRPQLEIAATNVGVGTAVDIWYDQHGEAIPNTPRTFMSGSASPQIFAYGERRYDRYVFDNRDAVIPIGIVSHAEANVALSFSGVEQFSGDVFFHDRALGRTQNLRTIEEPINVELTAGNNQGRFELRFVDGVPTDIETPGDAHSSDLMIYTSDNESVTVRSVRSTISEVRVFDMAGRMLKSLSPASNYVRINMSALPAGVYAIQAITNTDTRTENVIIR